MTAGKARTLRAAGNLATRLPSKVDSANTLIVQS
jgi:hypothetical protein